MLKFTHKVRVTGKLASLPPANEVWGKVIFSEACVKNPVHREGGSASVHAGIPHPAGSRHPSPQTRHPPGAGTPSPWTRYPPKTRYGQQAGGKHPTGMQSCYNCKCKGDVVTSCDRCTIHVLSQANFTPFRETEGCTAISDRVTVWQMVGMGNYTGDVPNLRPSLNALILCEITVFAIGSQT